jgi:hypothetical protein
MGIGKYIRIKSCLLVVLLTGCIEEVEIVYDLGIDGDSNCVLVQDAEDRIAAVTAYERLDAHRVCKGGKKLIEVDELVNARKNIVVLGTNDAFNEIDLDVFRNKAKSLMKDNTLCVLLQPSLRGKDTALYNQVLIDECPETLNPRDYGITCDIDEGVHCSQAEHDILYDALIEVL